MAANDGFFAKSKSALRDSASQMANLSDRRLQKRIAERTEYLKPMGYSYIWKHSDPSLKIDGLLLESDNYDIVEPTVGPRIQFGNNGSRNAPSDGSLRPSLHGYIAVPCPLDAPHVFIDGASFGAATPLAVASAAFHIGSMFDFSGWGESDGSQTAVQIFTRINKRLKLPKDASFEVHCAKPSSGAGLALMTPVAISLLNELTRSFSLELRDGRLIAYCPYGAVSTVDADIWRWTFSATSRMIDLVRLWTSDPEFGIDWPEYTAERIPRPKKMDGVLHPKRWTPAKGQK